MNIIKISLWPFIFLYQMVMAFFKFFFNYITYLNPLARLIFKICGWKATGELPKGTPQFVLIAAPHTSNWDFVIMLATSFIIRFKFKWMAKKSIFAGPWGPMFKALGGVPIDRSTSHNMVDQMVENFKKHEKMIVAVPPEGTRKKSGTWKSGFYHIALNAKVPVVCGFIDFKTKTAGLGPTIHLTGDPEVDLAKIRNFYKDMRGKFPDKQSDIRIEIK